MPIQRPVPVPGTGPANGTPPLKNDFVVVPVKPRNPNKNGIQIVIRDKNQNVSRCVTMERTDSLLDVFTILQNAKMVPADVLPWDQGVSEAVAAQMREKRRSELYDVGRLSADLSEIVLGPTPPADKWNDMKDPGMRSRHSLMGPPDAPTPSEKAPRPSFAMVYRELAAFMPPATLVQAQLLKDANKGPQVVSLVGKDNWIRAFQEAQQKLIQHLEREKDKERAMTQELMGWEQLPEEGLLQATMQSTLPDEILQQLAQADQTLNSDNADVSVLSLCRRRSSELPETVAPTFTVTDQANTTAAQQASEDLVRLALSNADGNWAWIDSLLSAAPEGK